MPAAVEFKELLVVFASDVRFEVNELLNKLLNVSFLIIMKLSPR